MASDQIHRHQRHLQFVLPQTVSMHGLDDMCGFGALPTAKTVGIALVHKILLQPLPGDYDWLMFRCYHDNENHKNNYNINDGM